MEDQEPRPQRPPSSQPTPPMMGIPADFACFTRRLHAARVLFRRGPQNPPSPMQGFELLGGPR